jgi:hypothetical protein
MLVSLLLEGGAFTILYAEKLFLKFMHYFCLILCIPD